MLSVLWLTVKLAGITTILLLVLATPLAWWLARGASRWKPVVGAVVDCAQPGSSARTAAVAERPRRSAPASSTACASRAARTSRAWA